jgi:hypothetical protein
MTTSTDRLTLLAESEINFEISYFFDSGFTVKLGDRSNGFLDDGLFEDLDDGIEWLWQTAEKHYPDSECFDA